MSMSCGRSPITVHPGLSTEEDQVRKYVPATLAAAVVARMTLDEKISQLAGIHTSTEFRTVPAIARLGIPKLLLTNGPAGVSTGGVTQPSATALPAPVALAASWDLRQATAYGDLEAQEVLSVGRDRKSTRLNSSHVRISYAVFCL